MPEPTKPDEPPPVTMDETILELTKRFYEDRALRIARVRQALDQPKEPR